MGTLYTHALLSMAIRQAEAEIKHERTLDRKKRRIKAATKNKRKMVKTSKRRNRT